VLELRLGAAPSRPVLTRIADVSMGNPSFALELARAAAGDPLDPSAALDPLAVPRSLRDTVARRLQSLTARARAVLAVAAALALPTTELIDAALRGWAPGGDEPDHGIVARSTEDEIAGLEREGLLIVDEAVRLSHLLIGEIVLGDLGRARRRGLHRRLAAIVTDHDEIARHLALGTVAPDTVTADRIEAAADRIARRGATLVAADLASAAVRLTPPRDPIARARRLTTEARLRLSVGDVGRARELVEQAEQAAPIRSAAEPDPARAEVRADLAWADGRLAAARDGLRKALSWAGDPSVRARIGARLVGLQVAVEPAGVGPDADAVLAIVDPREEPGIAGYVRINRFFGEVVAGGAPDLGMLEEGLRLEAVGLARGPISSIPLIWLNAIDDHDRARSRHELEDGWYRDRGQDGWRAERQAHRALTELRAGDWDRAEREIEASCVRIEAFEAPASWPTPFGWRALIDAHRGRIERARSTLDPLIATADGQQNRQWAGLLWSVAAFVEFAAGDAAAVDRAVADMRRRFEDIGFREAVGDRSEPIHVEALLELGQVDRAAEVVERLAARGRTIPRPWIELGLARSHALLLADTGHLDDGLERLASTDAALAARLPFDVAWNELVRGRLLRRSGRRRDAAAALTAGLAVFDRLGAVPWVRRTRRELERVGLRRGDPLALTPTERRIAELAAGGLTNREVAATAFVSAKTVEANLARVYRKLGIRSRAELGARMAPPSTESDLTQT
jgi:DNA-binding CsgD family transcriptional regulator